MIDNKVSDLKVLANCLSDKEYVRCLSNRFIDFFYDYDKQYKKMYLNDDILNLIEHDSFNKLNVEQLLHMIDCVDMYTSYHANKVLSKIKDLKNDNFVKIWFKYRAWEDVDYYVIDEFTSNRLYAFSHSKNGKRVYGVYIGGYTQLISNETAKNESEIFKVLKELCFNYYINENKICEM